MAVADLLKSRSTVQEIMNMSNRVFHSFYYRHYLKYKDQEQKQKQQQASGGGGDMDAEALAEAMEELE